MGVVTDYGFWVEQMVGAARRMVEVTDGLEEAPVPTCPGWSGRNLRAHFANVLRARVPVLSHPSPNPPGPEDWQRVRPDSAGLGEAVLKAADQVAGLLRTVGPGVGVWSFYPPDMSTTFWARRLAHEAFIHRSDGELTAGLTPEVAPDVAADGVGELLRIFLARPGRPLGDDGPAAVVHLQGRDAACEWSVRLGGPEVVVDEGPVSADCRIVGPAAELYLWGWGRAQLRDSEVSGDRSLPGRLRALAARAT